MQTFKEFLNESYDDIDKSKDIDKALNSRRTEIRTAAASNPHATKENLDKALNDEDENVQSAAARKLRKHRELYEAQ